MLEFGGEGKIVIGSGYRGRIALIGVAVVALLLSGCGRKGMLEPPPSAGAMAAPQQGEPAQNGPSLGEADHGQLGSDRQADQATGRPARQSFFLDWLLK
jgi:predicted small lipoprotein YifL